MPGVKFVDHCNERVLLIDFANAKDDQEIVGIAGEAMRIVRSINQQSSIRGLLDLSGISLNKVVRKTMMKMSKNNRLYMKSVAFVGLGVLLSPLFKGLLFVTGRSNHKVFSTRSDALDWLVKT
jgi:hypothetical protein